MEEKVCERVRLKASTYGNDPLDKVTSDQTMTRRCDCGDDIDDDHVDHEEEEEEEEEKKKKKKEGCAETASIAGLVPMIGYDGLCSCWVLLAHENRP